MKSNTRTQNKYVNYTAEVVLKRVLKYVWKSKFMIICSLLFLIAYTFLELYQPKLINKMITYLVFKLPGKKLIQLV